MSASPSHELGADVRRRRKELRLTQADVADLAGVSAKLVRDVEAGKPTLRLDTLRRVLAAVGLELVTAVRT